VLPLALSAKTLVRKPVVALLKITNSRPAPGRIVPPVIVVFVAAAEPKRMPPVLTVLTPASVSVRAVASLSRMLFTVAPLVALKDAVTLAFPEKVAAELAVV
jgi:hypothetical protein